MLDIKLIRENPDDVKMRLRAKGADCDETVDRILELYATRNQLKSRADNARSEQNKVSKQIPAMKKAGQDITEILTRMNALKEEIKELDARLKEVDRKNVV